MIPYYVSPVGDRGKSVKISKDTIGDGPTGKKSASYRHHKPLLESAYDREKEVGLRYVDNTAMTPAFFSEFLKRAGASHENPGTREAIDKMPFTQNEINGIMEAISPFSGLLVAVRSDEPTASGNGLWHTDFSLVKSPSASAKGISKQIKDILKSDFSRNVVAFKKRLQMPMDETSGVFIMPVIGEKLEPAFATAYAANIITDFLGNSDLVCVGIGIGGANNRATSTAFLHNLRAHHYHSILARAGKRDARVFMDGKIREFSSGFLFNDLWADVEMFPEIADNFTKILRASIHAFKNLANSPKYLELALSMQSPWNWDVVQVSDIALRKVERPEVANGQILLRAYGEGNMQEYGCGVAGRGVAIVEDAFRLEYSDYIFKLKELNRQAKGYALFTTVTAQEFAKIPFHYYSNASAVILCGEDRSFNSLGSHFNGALREAGILVIDGEMDRKFLSALKENAASKRKLLIYANDAEEEGFVAATE